MGLSLRVHEIATKEILFTTLLDGLLVHRSLPSAYLPIFSNTLVFLYTFIYHLKFLVRCAAIYFLHLSGEWHRCSVKNTTRGWRRLKLNSRQSRCANLKMFLTKHTITNRKSCVKIKFLLGNLAATENNGLQGLLIATNSI